MKGIQHFVISKIGISIILVAFVYQLIMMGILLPGYAAVPNNLDQLQVTVLNEDPKHHLILSPLSKIFQLHSWCR